MTPTPAPPARTDAARARHLRQAERCIREARDAILAAQLPPEMWRTMRESYANLQTAQDDCAVFASRLLWRDADARKEQAA